MKDGIGTALFVAAGAFVFAGFTPVVRIAGLFHDLIEDTETTTEEISDKFGKQVASLVLEVTDVSKPTDGNRAARKAIDLDHLSLCSYAGASIKLADLIDNSRTIVRHDPDFAKIYLQEKAKVLEVLRGHPLLFDYASEVLILSLRCLERPV